jgi:hypothetical protein
MAFSTFLILAILFVSENVSRTTEASHAERNFELVAKASELVTQIQRERGASAGYLGGGMSINQLRNWREKTDGKIEPFQEAVKRASMPADSLATLTRAIDMVKDARSATDDKQQTSIVIANYTSAVETNAI